MVATVAERGLRRREFLGSALGALAASSVMGTRAFAHPNSDIRYAISGQMWMGDGINGKPWPGNIEEGVRETARMGLDGIEPFRNHIVKYLDDPMAFKRQLDAAGIAMASCSNGGRGMSTNFIDPAKTPQTVIDHVAFARDFLRVFGCTAFKFNMGGRPASGVMTDDDLKTLAGTLSEIGRQTIAFGIRAAPHPHLWGPMEREHEVRRVMELTDPRYVFLTTDTAHLTLGGMDALAIMTDYYPRIAEVHYKDCDPKYRGNSVSPTPADHRKSSLYLNLGAGGVDLPAIHKMLLARQYKGWISLDYDAPRPGDGTGTIEQNIVANKNYLVNVLQVTTLGPTIRGKSACDIQCTPPV
jgi:inosose dehydratase